MKNVTNLPQILLMENVDAILFEKNRKHFFQWCNRLEEFGYKNYYQVLNAKNYGIPQNRNRCFMVSILGDYYFEFPKPIKLELCVKDMLEKEVPEKYYISNERVKELLSKEYDGKAGTLPDGIAIRTNNEKGYDIAQDGDTINLEQPNSKTRRGRVGKQIAQTIMTSTEQAVVEKEIISCEIRHDKGIVTYKGNVMGALRTISQCGDKHIIEYQKEDLVCYNQFKPEYKYRIRKLMPIECYRLMGFTREDFFKVKKAGISDSQCYKQAGNSIVVNVLEAIFRNMNMKGVKRWQK